MIVSQTETIVCQTDLTPLPIPPPRFADDDTHQHKPRSVAEYGDRRRFRVIKYATASEGSFETDELTGEVKETGVSSVHFRVMYDGKGAKELNSYLWRNRGQKIWHPSSLFEVQKYSGGQWYKIDKPPY